MLFVEIPAWFYLGAWLLCQLIVANFGLFSAPASGAVLSFFPHVGGFGVVVASALLNSGRIVTQATPRRLALAPF